MASNDSDSSVEEDSDYIETEVLLGYASNNPSNDTFSRLGGRPEWLDSSCPPPPDLARCKVCNDFLVLLLQLNGDLPDRFPGHERRLYLLSCLRKSCRRKEGSIRILRGLRTAESPKPPIQDDGADQNTVAIPSKPVPNIGETLFGGKLMGISSPNPFSTGASNSIPRSPSSATSTQKPTTGLSNVGHVGLPIAAEQIGPRQACTRESDLPKTFASALALNTESVKQSKVSPPPEPWPPESKLPPPYPISYLDDADYEILEKTEEAPVPKPPLDIDEPSHSGIQQEDKGVFESTIDKTFQKFADRLAQNPEQVLRYEFGGRPLVYSRHDGIGRLFSSVYSTVIGYKPKSSKSVSEHIPRCSNCGAGRVFEAQLTPHAIMVLESEEGGFDGMDWGTIIVAVCENDCQSEIIHHDIGYVEEWAGVQWEELSVRR